MTTHTLNSLAGDAPLAYLAAIGLLRLVSRKDPAARLWFARDGRWVARLKTSVKDLSAFVLEDRARWVEHPALAFARGADRKIQDLKHPPEVYREQLRSAVDAWEDTGDREEVDFLTAFATGVAVDGTGQTKPTALHFCAGQQRFMDAVLQNFDLLNQDDADDALLGPWAGNKKAKSLRWRSSAARVRALLSYDPGSTDAFHVPVAEWLAFNALPLFPSAPVGTRIQTACFTGRGKQFKMTWPLWDEPLDTWEVRALLVRGDLAKLQPSARASLGIVDVLQAQVVRSDQGYGSFTAPTPV